MSIDLAQLANQIRLLLSPLPAIKRRRTKRCQWPVKVGFADHPDLAGYEVYACGSVKMVEAAVPDFLAHGLAEQFCFSDAFTPSAPR